MVKRVPSTSAPAYSSSTAGFDYDAVVIGGGSAGLAAATGVAACLPDARVLIVEREEYLGGVLPQCVHDGFGLHVFGTSLTGPEYAQRWIEQVQAYGIDVALASTVLAVVPLDDGYCIDLIGEVFGGPAQIRTRSVICATGCRERTRGALQIPGGRPAGVFTAGCAQYMVNIANQLPGTKVVILGSGDIGLIMARRMTLEGAEVRLVLGQEATGLVRNHIRCIQDFGIPIRYGWGLVSIHGYGQLQGVTVAPMRADGSLDLAGKEYIRCNALLLAVGLIPEREVLQELAVAPGMSAAEIERDYPGLYLCGNANEPHDLVDQVSQEGLRTGCAAARFIADGTGRSCEEPPAAMRRILKRTIEEPRGRMNETHAELPADVTRIVCTVCPTGCVMLASRTGEVTGNACEQGEQYARQELGCPRRLFTGTVRVRTAGEGERLLPVRTSTEIPLGELAAVARRCRRIVLSEDVQAGAVIEEDVAGTGAALVASADSGLGAWCTISDAARSMSGDA